MSLKLNYPASRINETLDEAVMDCRVQRSPKEFALNFENNSGGFQTRLPAATSTACGIMTPANVADLEQAKQRIEELEAQVAELQHAARIYRAIRLSNVPKTDDIIVTPTGTKGQLGLDMADGKLFLFIARQYTTMWTASQSPDGIAPEGYKKGNVIINAGGTLYGFNGSEFVH